MDDFELIRFGRSRKGPDGSAFQTAFAYFLGTQSIATSDGIREGMGNLRD